MNQQHLDKVAQGQGFIAALDQSGGSTPRALKLYGINESSYSGDAQMFDLVHEMRTRIITSASFDGKRVLGAILFEDTMDRQIDGRDAAVYLWEVKQVVPFLKVDKGLADEADGVQLMKPMPELDALLARAHDKRVFGTKMRSVIQSANAKGIADIVEQQFEVGKQILAAGLMPILEPEINIKAADKQQAEDMLKAEILKRMDSLPQGSQVMFKLSLPSTPGFYDELIKHPGVLRMVALSGGYTRDGSNRLLEQNPGLIASFSRALTEGLTKQQTDAEFDALLDEAIESIYQASIV